MIKCKTHCCLYTIAYSVIHNTIQEAIAAKFRIFLFETGFSFSGEKNLHFTRHSVQDCTTNHTAHFVSVVPSNLSNFPRQDDTIQERRKLLRIRSFTSLAIVRYFHRRYRRLSLNLRSFNIHLKFLFRRARSLSIHRHVRTYLPFRLVQTNRDKFVVHC